MARVVVLGTAQDGGIPHMGCRRDCCGDGVVPRLVSSIALFSDGGTYLFDATPDIRAQASLLAAQPGAHLHECNLVHGVFITHAHVGHYVGLLQFGKESMHSSQLPVYCSAKFADFVRANEPFRSLVVDGRISLVVVTPGERIDLAGGASVTPVEVKHRSELSDTLAFVLRGPGRRDDSSGGLLYCPDADDWSWPVEAALRGVQTALMDGTFFSEAELPGRDMRSIPHPLVMDSVASLADLAAGPPARQIFFTHFNHTNRVLRDAAIVPHPFKRLEDGQVFALA